MSKGQQLNTQTLKCLGTLMNKRLDGLPGVEIGRATRLQSGTLYPILLRLEQAGWLKSYWESEPPKNWAGPGDAFMS